MIFQKDLEYMLRIPLFLDKYSSGPKEAESWIKSRGCGFRPAIANLNTPMSKF